MTEPEPCCYGMCIAGNQHSDDCQFFPKRNQEIEMSDNDKTLPTYSNDPVLQRLAEERNRGFEPKAPADEPEPTYAELSPGDREAIIKEAVETAVGSIRYRTKKERAELVEEAAVAAVERLDALDADRAAQKAKTFAASAASPGGHVTVSRTVHFYPTDPAKGGAPLAAVVAAVIPNYTPKVQPQAALSARGVVLTPKPVDTGPIEVVHLAVFNPAGHGVEWKKYVPYSETPKVGHWSWPPRV